MSSDPLASIAEGAVKGILEWSEDKARRLAKRFLERDVAFIGNEEIIQQSREERRSPEWKELVKYVARKEDRILIQLGLTLRRLEDTQQLQKLRDRIVKKYGPRGLHLAQFVQNEIMGAYLFVMTPRVRTENDLRRYVNEFLMNIEKFLVFLKAADTDQKAHEVAARLHSLQPPVLVIFASKTAIMPYTRIVKALEKKAPEYEQIHLGDGEKKITILHKGIF